MLTIEKSREQFTKDFYVMREALRPIFEKDRIESEQRMREQSLRFVFMKQLRKLLSLLTKKVGG